MNTNYFIVTKPLQYFNVINIKTSGKRILLLVNSFSNIDVFLEQINKIHYWDKIILCEKNKDAYDFVKKKMSFSDSLFIDSDYGLLKNIWLSRIRAEKIFVYEEGIGSYRNDLLSSSNKPFGVKKILSLIGIKDYFGGSPFVQGIYLYDHEMYIHNTHNKKVKLLSFERTFLQNMIFAKEHFSLQFEKIEQIISDIPKASVVKIYLTSWCFDERIYDILEKEERSFLILKPHPNIKIEYKNDFFDLVLDGGIMIEFFLYELWIRGYIMTVFHQGSSALMYLNNIKSCII